MLNPLVVGERLYLRPLEESDADVMAAGAALETDRMMDRLRLPHSSIALVNWIKELNKHRPPEGISMAVCLKEDDRCIGNVELHSIDYVHRNAETGSWINLPQDRGQGYGTEAKMLLLEFAFEHLNLHVLMSYVWEPNARSVAALAKQGYRLAGRYRLEDVFEGEYRDALVFDVLRADWLAAREALKRQTAQ